MTIDPATLHPRDFYRHLIACITPRPIAWVSTVSAEGVTNLAPFSFFNGLGANPPSVMFSPTNDRHGHSKHTLRNVRAMGQFVVNVVPFRLAEAMNATSAEWEEGVSEFEACGIPTVASQRVRPPGVAGAPVRMECEVIQVVTLAEGAMAAHVVIGRILLMYADDAVLGPDGQIDPEKLDTIGRMGGSLYTRTRDRFAMDRPTKG